jgi:hypothetical protein
MCNFMAFPFKRIIVLPRVVCGYLIVVRQSRIKRETSVGKKDIQKPGNSVLILPLGSRFRAARLVENAGGGIRIRQFERSLANAGLFLR